MKRPPGGFVLVLVLAVLVILSVLGATVGAITQRLRDEQLERQRQLDAEIALASTRATVLYLLTSQRMTFGGLTVDSQVVLSEDERAGQRSGEQSISYMPVGNELALDGTAHQGIAGARFALQDDRGLLAVNWTEPALLERFLAAKGPASLPIATLMNLLHDYQDSDDLYRLNSAERQEYLRDQRAPPTNHTLLTPMELRRVKGWDQTLADTTDLQLSDSLTVVRSAQVNVNTAPARVLQALPGVDKQMAERVIAARALAPFISLGAFYQLLGAVPGNDELLSLYPMESGTLKLWSPDGGTIQVLHWTLTPRDDGGRPWREDYEFTLPSDPTADRGPATPVPAKVFAEPDASTQ